MLPCHEIRTRFANAMSEMYQAEVPKYGALLQLVQHVNQQTVVDKVDRLNLNAVRHGAIRLGKADELFHMRRLFAVMGMFPVSYYDLSEAGIPVHSTAFRPITRDELSKNPFRMFTSLLRLDLIADETLRLKAQSTLATRQIFSPELFALLELSEQKKGLNEEQTTQFIKHALGIFRWQQQATVSQNSYEQLMKAHRLMADIVCFKGPHINHLTPKILDIDQAQAQMSEFDLDVKALIEGPPKRKHPILLRQTSFKALSEKVRFTSDAQGLHTARFGEIEQRGVALTRKGRNLYDSLLNNVRASVPNAANQVDYYYQELEAQFASFPDDLLSLFKQKLAYFCFHLKGDKTVFENRNLTELLEQNALLLEPITYEDFLPVSAAGIFKSNLKDQTVQAFECSPNQKMFENDLGCPVIDEFEMYEKIQNESLLACLQGAKLTAQQQATLLEEL